jgi:plasmid stabilization system protein ParE
VGSPGKRSNGRFKAALAVELILAPETEQDISGAYAWYEDLRPGLGAEFLGCVDACIETIVRMPQMHEAVYENYRRALVRRFPYVIFYEHASDVATIYGVLHSSRSPDKWRGRIL